jgi:precorrin-8X/cobalt-precorrin-8 methylmutase
MKPHEIEQLSFQIIDKEAGPHFFTPEEWAIVRRIIHTTADFEYMQTIRFHPNAIAQGLAAIRQGKSIYTDTQMAKVGMRKTDLARWGSSVHCLIGDDQVKQSAAQKGITRAYAAVDAAAANLNGGLYVVGNAPTALLRLIELVQTGRILPALIVGMPVGFVNAAESKSALSQLDCPYITNLGRKGGSNVAASIINALVILAGTEPSA